MFPKLKSSNIKLFSYFIFLSLFGAIMLKNPAAYISKEPVPFIDALFVSVSAVCVTGLSTVSMDLFSNFGFIIILFLIEFGGLGIITFVAFYLAVPSKKVSSVNRKLVKDYFIDDVENNPRKILSHIISYTLIIQLTGTVLLSFGLKMHGEPDFIFYALFLSISAFCNAGFSPYANSLGYFQNSPLIIITIMLLITLGGIGFIVMKNIIQIIKTRKSSNPKKMTLHSKVVLSVSSCLVFGGMLLFFLSEYKNSFAGLSLQQKIMAAFFQSVTPRTAGFETILQKNFSSVSKLLTIFLMFIGGSSGSIAGGVKTTTFFIAMFYAFNGNEARNTLKIGNRVVDASTVNKAVTIITRSLLIICISVFMLAVSERDALASGVFQISDIIFESVSGFATVGLTQGITSYLSLFGKIIIILTMFIGRTGIFAMALHLSGKKVIENNVEYPNDPVMVG